MPPKYTERQIELQNKKAIDHAVAPPPPKNRYLTGKPKQPHAGALMGADVDGGSAPPPVRKKGNKY